MNKFLKCFDLVNLFRRIKNPVKPPTVCVIRAGSITNQELFYNSVVIIEYSEQTVITYCVFDSCNILHIDKDGKLKEGFPNGELQI